MSPIFKKLFFVVFWGVTVSSCAQSKKTTAAASEFLEVKETWAQRTLPGRKEGNIQTVFHSSCEWTAADPPDIICFKNNDLWMSCDLVKEKGPIKTADLQQGTQFELLAFTSKAIAPQTAVPATVSVAVVFKIANNWYYLPINGITKKPDLVMP